ncbi:uncharacterized protein LOC128210257 [Mya arenaria]|uniref:uncharacterized protein LOC128210257 n=1 Tax=Mya arenaria TaxID=6604 RepID=UPI0022E8B6B8|nr:uncharacterized protein LOC128210257 [Mya arenaria]
MVIGVAVGVGVPVVAVIVLIGLVFLRRRGMISRPSINETKADANAVCGVTNGDVSFSPPVLSNYEQLNQHRDNDSVRAENVYSRINKQNPKIKAQDSKAPYGKEKKRFRTASDIIRPAKETKILEYENTCLKDPTNLVQRKDHDHIHKVLMNKI